MCKKFVPKCSPGLERTPCDNYDGGFTCRVKSKLKVFENLKKNYYQQKVEQKNIQLKMVFISDKPWLANQNTVKYRTNVFQAVALTKIV